MESPEDLVDLINRLLASGDYDWAQETLEGILTTVAETQRVTRRQQEAVEHIMEGRLRHDLGR